MADDDSGSPSLRDSHFNQQRSSLRSDRSLRTPSRPPSAHLFHDFTLGEESDIPAVPASPTPALVIPRRKQSLERGRRGGSRSRASHRRGSSHNTARSGSRGNIDELLVPEQNWYDNNKEIEVQPSVEVRPERGRRFQHSTLEEESVVSRDTKRPRRSRRSSLRSSPFSRRGTPATDLEITALPSIPDASGSNMNEKLSSSNEYAQSKPTLHQQQISRYATHLYTISYLIIFSILGTLARLSLQWLTFYPGAPITFAELWANVAGTLLMGFLAEDSRFFRLEWGNQGPTSTIAALDDEETAPEEVAAAKAIHSRAKKTIPLYIGLATGFCGSFTSFSSFMRDVFFALSNDLPSPINHPYPPPDLPNTSSTISRNGGHSFMAVCAILLVTMALCYSALKAGAHIANFLDPYTPTLPFRATRRFLDPLIVFVAWGAWIGAVIMAIWPPDRPGGSESKGDRVNETWRGHVLFACVFAPVGCLLRFYASLYLNHFVASFPLGTFAVNIFGTAVLGMAFDLQHVSIGTSGVGGGRVGCQVLQGVMDGFCGSLTTISTWILEIHGLRKAHGYFYSLSSIGVGLGTLVAIMGSVRWTVGWSAPVCGV